MRLCFYERSDLGYIGVDEWPEGLVLWVGGQIKWKSCWDDAKMTDKPKHIMTRAEAIACFKKHMPDTSRADELIDFYVAAGMLEIKEEEASFAYAIQQHNLVPNNISLSCINNILAAIAAMGYKIKAK